MPRVNSLESQQNAARPQVRKPVRTTPYDQTRLQPTTDEPTGKLGGLGSKTSGGWMNTGGKRRPGHDARKGID